MIMQFEVVYKNGVKQILTLVSYEDWLFHKDIKEKILTIKEKEKPDQKIEIAELEKQLEPFAYIGDLFKAGKGFTTQSPIYKSFFNGGNLILPDNMGGTTKIQITKIN